MMAELAEFVGKRVVLELKEGATLNGFVHALDATTSKLTLHKVSNSDGKKLPGLKHFFDYEVESISVLEEKLKKSTVNTQDADKREKGIKLLKNKSIPKHLQKLQDFQQANIELRQLHVSDEEGNATEKPANQTSEYDSSSDPEQLDDVDAPYVLINKLDQRFRDAVQYVSQQAIIGFGIQAVCPGRFGKLCWLQFGTAEHVFIFDILSMGPLSFEEGIKGILESPDIQKVMHDCRLVSDMLHHQYDTSLINIFDTEVADVFVYRLHHNNDWPRYVQALPHCLVDHLNLEPEEVHAMKVRQGFQEEDQEVWAKRPASRDILMAAMKNVMHLRKLRYVLEEKMMTEFVAGVDIYLSQVKNASKQDAKKEQVSTHKLPLAFQELPSMMSHRDHRRFYRRSRAVIDEYEKSDVKGFRDNVAVINDVNVSYSRDSPWHTLQEGKKNYGKVLSKTEVTGNSLSPTKNQGNASMNCAPSEMSPNSPTEVKGHSTSSKGFSEDTDECSPVKHLSDSDTVKEELLDEDISGCVKFQSMKIKPFKPLPSLKIMSPANTAEKSGSGKVSDNTSKSDTVSDSDENGSASVGKLIRDALKQNNVQLQNSDLDQFKIMPAGRLINYNSGINDRTTRRRMREFETKLLSERDTTFHQVSSSGADTHSGGVVVQESDSRPFSSDICKDSVPQHQASTRCLFHKNATSSPSSVSDSRNMFSSFVHNRSIVGGMQDISSSEGGSKPSAQSINGLRALQRLLQPEKTADSEKSNQSTSSPESKHNTSVHLYTNTSNATYMYSPESTCTSPSKNSFSRSTSSSSLSSPQDMGTTFGTPMGINGPSPGQSPSASEVPLSDVELTAINRAMNTTPNRIEQLKILMSATKKGKS